MVVEDREIAASPVEQHGLAVHDFTHVVDR